MTTESNPLLAARELPEFSAIQPAHVAPAVDALLTEFRPVVERLVADPDARDFARVDFRGFDAQNGPYPTTGDNIAKIYTVTLGEREPVAIQASEDDDHKLEQKVYFSGAVFSNKKVLA